MTNTIYNSTNYLSTATKAPLSKQNTYMSIDEIIELNNEYFTYKYKQKIREIKNLKKNKIKENIYE